MSQKETVRVSPALPDRIMGRGAVDAAALSGFLCSANPILAPASARELASLYVEEAAVEGVSHDVAFSQMCLETGFQKFGGLVTSDMHNYCGLGSTGPGQPGVSFPTARLGVRAHIQHLKGYASTAPLSGAIVDPRYRWIHYGSAPTVFDLAGKWAADRDYGKKITAIIDRLYTFAFSR